MVQPELTAAAVAECRGIAAPGGTNQLNHLIQTVMTTFEEFNPEMIEQPMYESSNNDVVSGFVFAQYIKDRYDRCMKQQSIFLSRRELVTVKSKPNQCYTEDGRPCALINQKSCSRNPLTVICLDGLVFIDKNETETINQ